MRALVLGHFSTVGDVDSLAYVTETLRAEGIAYDVAPFMEKLSLEIEGAIDRDALDPSAYTHLIVVCGPFWPELLARRGFDLEPFAHCTRIGINLTMVEPVDEWNPFHLLLERDSDRAARPDLTFLVDTPRVPVVGLCTIARQKEYGERQRHAEAIERMRQLLRERDVATVEIDTRWPAHRNSGGLGSPAQVSSLIERMDVLLTNRLHGMVYALKSGTPVLAVDPVDGGDKIVAQARVLGWPAVATVDSASPEWLRQTLDWCLSEEGRSAAAAVAEAARTKLQPIPLELRAALRTQYPFIPLPPMPGAAGRRSKGLWRLLRRGPR